MTNEFWYFHHCVGDWYFFLGNCSRRNWHILLYSFLKGFVLSRRRRERPWWILPAMVFWLAGLPVAGWRRYHGPVLIDMYRGIPASTVRTLR
jgi:hypothetical protein